MKALLSKDPGGPETLVLEEVPALQARAGQAVIQVKAVGVNFPDVLVIEDKYQFKPKRPFAPGGELAGIVKSVGEGVTAVKPGDRVMGGLGSGGMAEEALADASRLIKMPDAMPFVDAAAMMATYGTSLHALRDRAMLKPGQKLLVLGAAGGVGLAAVELGKAMGATVVAAASSQEKVDLCLQRGADSGVVYPRGPFDREGQKALAQLFKDATGPDGADVIYDPVGDAYAEPALRSIAWEGRYLVVGFAGGEIPKVPLNLALLKGCEIVGVFAGAWFAKDPARRPASVAELLRMYAEGKIKPYISAEFPLEQGADAIRHLADRKAIGKVVVTID
jgi:NADPH2:quinone reductase